MQRETNKRHRADLGRIALVFAELAGAPREWREALKEIDMQESQFMIEWTADAREKERVATSRETLLREAQKRFKGELTEEDKQMISTQESALVFSGWLDAVVESETYADFRAALRVDGRGQGGAGRIREKSACWAANQGAHDKGRVCAAAVCFADPASCFRPGLLSRVR